MVAITSAAERSEISLASRRDMSKRNCPVAQAIKVRPISAIMPRSAMVWNSGSVWVTAFIKVSFTVKENIDRLI